MTTTKQIKPSVNASSKMHTLKPDLKLNFIIVVSNPLKEYFIKIQDPIPRTLTVSPSHFFTLI